MSDTQEQWLRAKAIFQQAITRKIHDRKAFVADACADDEGLAAHVQALLDADAETHTPLERPCLLYTSPSPRDLSTSRMPSSA